MKITLYGAASAVIDRSYVSAVEDLGKRTAERGHTLVFGGGCTGLMGAMVRGVKGAGGKAIGITPEFFRTERYEALYTDCDEFIWTKDMYERKRLLEETCDAFIVAPGGFGTFDEFFGILTTKQLDRHDKPIAVFNVNGFFDDLKKLIDRAVAEDFVKEKCYDLFRFFPTADGLLEYLEAETERKKTTDKFAYKK